MALRFSCFLALLFFYLMEGVLIADTNTRVTNPSAVNLELGGRGMIYSLAFDRVLNENLAAGIGIGSVTTSSTTLIASQSSLVIPAYLNYYFSQDAGSLYLTGGATLVANASELDGLTSFVGGMKFSSSPLIPTAGIGYEFRSDAGYLFRFAGYALLAQNIVPWVGFTLGYSF